MILKYLMSSLSSFAVDIILFSVFILLTENIFTKYYIVIFAYLAKIFSCTYSYIINKEICFSK